MFSFARRHLCTIAAGALAALAIAAPVAAQKKEDTGVVGPSFKAVSYTHLTLPTILLV